MASNTEGKSREPIRIDIVSDVVCPWCIIGYKQLERAQAETGLPAILYWHPFELNSDMPEDGQDLFEHIAGKYGTSKDESVKARTKLTALADELGFLMNYRDDMRMQNTFRAHQLLHWAASKQRQHRMKLALFAAYFSDGRNVNDPAFLVEVAGSIGLDAEEASAVLNDQRFAEQVRKHETFWTSRGV
jgi:predicted DsbA family dithiol-disulfide isomerase